MGIGGVAGGYRCSLRRSQVRDLGGWGVFIPWGGATLDDGEGHVGSGTVDLGGSEGHRALLHEAVHEEADVYPAVVAVGLLGYGLPCAADEGPQIKLAIGF